jgi:hypothetical protein
MRDMMRRVLRKLTGHEDAELYRLLGVAVPAETIARIARDMERELVREGFL